MRRLVIGTVLLGATAAFTLPGTARAAECTFKGPQWKQAGEVGTTYVIDTQGVSCGYGIPYARKLAGSANKKPFYPVKGGPAGWTCNAQASGPKITSGACVKGTKRFGWHAASF